MSRILYWIYYKYQGKKFKERVRELIGQSILQLVKEHKIYCSDSHCGVSTFLMGDLYRATVKRQLTDEEIKIFL